MSLLPLSVCIGMSRCDLNLYFKMPSLLVYITHGNLDMSTTEIFNKRLE
jgi:hypothetical protein